MKMSIRILLARLALVAYRCRWPRISAWLDGARREVVVDAGDFLKQEGLMLPGRSVEDLAAAWPELSRALWEKKTPGEFYVSWDGETGAANLAANAVDQLCRPYIAAAFMRHMMGYRGKILDFGCGTATLSLAWRKDFAPEAKLFLADVDNLARRFVKWRLDKHSSSNVEMVALDLKGISDGGLDVLVCLDVLEHLPNPSAVFLAMEPKLKAGGLLFIQAPWGGGFEHLDEAPIDWGNNGGARLLATGYRKLDRMKPWGDLSGVFVKVGR